MKILVTSIILSLLAIANEAIAQSAGDFRSKKTGAWNASSTWQTFDGANWVNAAKFPTSADGVITIQNNDTVTISSSVTADQLVVAANGTLNITTGTLTMADGAGIDLACTGIINFSGGSFKGAGTVTIQTGGVYNWMGGTNSSSTTTTINAGASFTMSSSTHYITSTVKINNAGTWTWTAGPLVFNNSKAVITNGGTFNIYTDDDVSGTTSNSATFTNQATGIINKLGSPGDETAWQGTGTFSNAGTININASAIGMYVNCTNTGIINVGFGASIHYPSGLSKFNTGSVITGLGNMNFDGATDSINAGAISIAKINLMQGVLAVKASISIPSGTTLTLTSGGTLTGKGNISFIAGSIFNWAGGTIDGSGTMSIASGVAFNISGDAHYLAGSKIISNAGLCTWTAGPIIYNNSTGSFSNAGTFNIYTDDDIDGANSATAKFNNAAGGIINKIGSINDETSLSNIGSFSNAGIINVNASRIRLNVNTTNTGTYNIALGSNANFTNGNARFNAGSVVTGSGSINFDGALDTVIAISTSVKAINVSLGSITITPNITIAAGNTLNLSGGLLNGKANVIISSGATFNWAGGTIGGTDTVSINAGATFNMKGDAHYLTDKKIVSNAGTWKWTGGDILYNNATAVINNSGIFNINADNNILGTNSSNSQFNNNVAGVINKIGSPDQFTTIDGIGTFNNSGTVNLRSSTIKLNIGGVQNGTYNIFSGAQLTGFADMTYTGAAFKNNGTVSLDSIRFAGTAVQSLNGTGIINTLAINNSQGVTLGGTQTIRKALVLTKGKLMLGNYDVLLPITATLVGGDATSYCLTNGTGGLQRPVINNSADVFFPVGPASSYMPVKINLTPAGIPDTFKVSVLPNLYNSYTAGIPTGNTVNGNIVNGTWMISEKTPGGSSANITFQWNATDEASSFSRATSRYGNFTNNAWVLDAAQGATGSNPYTLSRSGITAFGEFGIINQFVSCTNSYSALCIGGNFNVPYKVVGTLGSGNTFTAQLSNAAGSFASPVVIGTRTSLLSGNINAVIPSTITAGTGYRIRVVSSNPAMTSQDNGTDIAMATCFMNGLPDTSSIKQSTQNTGIQVIKLMAYPNPNKGEFNIAVHFKQEEHNYVLVQIVNDEGKIIYAENHFVAGNELTGHIKLKLSPAAGILLLKIITGKEFYSGKILIQH